MMFSISNLTQYLYTIRIGSGSSQYSNGIVRTINISPTETIFSKYSTNLYQKFQEQGHNISIYN